tara:strand:- start:18834 stop:19727 length:894 start_codon:yes stop_codon:yes gene_type:complete
MEPQDARDPAGPGPAFHPLFETVPLTISNVLSLSHRLYTARWGLIVGAFSLAVVIQWIIGAVTGLIDIAIFGQGLIVSPLNLLAQILISTPLLVGALYVAVRVYRNEPATLGDLWIGFSRWLPVVAVGLLVQLAVYGAMLPIGVAAGILAGAGGGPATVAVAVILAIGLLILAIWLSIRLYFATMLCADPAGPNLGVVDSITTSWRITSGHAWTLFVVAVAMGIVAMLSLVLLIVPFFLYGGPVLVCGGAAAYALACHKAGIIPLAPYDDCPHCGYSMRDAPTDICPECGNVVHRAG